MVPPALVLGLDFSLETSVSEQDFHGPVGVALPGGTTVPSQPWGHAGVGQPGSANAELYVFSTILWSYNAFILLTNSLAPQTLAESPNCGHRALC